MESTIRFITFLLVVLVVVPSAVLADVRQFIPKISDYAGFLEWNSSYETNEDTRDGKGIKTKDLFLREKLELSAAGYVYHPRFILFLLKGSGGLKHESFSSETINVPFKTLSAREYEFRTLILPEHPYNLELFTLRLEPLTKRGFSEQSRSAASNTGAIFRYKKKPYFLNAHYLINSTESTAISSTTKRYGLLGTYYKELVGERYYSFSGSYEHVNSVFTGLGSTSDSASLSNAVSLKTFNIASDVALSRSSQGEGSSGFLHDSKNISWRESAHIRLPWGFDSSLSYGLTKDTITTAGLSTPSQTVSSTAHNASFTITHALYKSLFSSYGAGLGALRSDTGDSSTFSHTLGFRYVKNIPGGRLRSGVSVGRSTTDRRGSGTITNEPHAAVPVPGSFRLNNQDVNVATIIVWLRSPDVEGVLILLQPDINYVITPFANTFQINIQNLPPQFVVPGTYDFVVSYMLSNADTKLRVASLNYNVGFELFGEKFFPYYNHSESREDALSGFVDHEPFHLSSDAFGFQVRLVPFTLLGEYQVVDSNINPSRSWKAEISYQQDVAQNTQLQATGRYSSTYYPQGSGGNETSYTERLMGGSAGVQQRFPKLNLFFSLGGAYSRLQGLITSTTYSLNSNLVWNVGKINVTAGAAASFAESGFETENNRRMNQYYYLNVRRKLF